MNGEEISSADVDHALALALALSVMAPESVPVQEEEERTLCAQQRKEKE